MHKDDEEVFDIVNENNITIGQKVRKQVHLDGDYHRAVNIFLVNPSRDAILIQLRATSKRICPDMWDVSCAEHLQPGERYPQAAIRGLWEELGLVIGGEDIKEVHGDLLKKCSYPKQHYEDNEFIRLYLYQCEQDTPLVLDDTEVQEVAWVPIVDLQRQLALHPQQYTPTLHMELSYLVDYLAE